MPRAPPKLFLLFGLALFFVEMVHVLMTALVPTPTFSKALQRDNASSTTEEYHMEEVVDSPTWVVEEESQLRGKQHENKESSVEKGCLR